MKRNITTIMLLFPLLLRSQTKEIDSLHHLARNTKGTAQVILYSMMADLAKDINADSGFYFASTATALAEMSGRPDAKITAAIAMGKVLIRRASYHLAAKTFSRAIQLASEQRSDSLMAVSLNGLGTAYWQLGNHAEALENHYKALGIRERLHDKKGIAAAKASIGMVYQTQEKLYLAEKYTGEALEILKKENDYGLLIVTLHTLANIYGMQGKISEAMKIDAEGLAITEKVNNHVQKALFYDNMGNCYFYGNPPDYDKALEYFRKALMIDSAFLNKKQMSDSYMNIGNVFAARRQYEKALANLKRSVALAGESGYTQGKLKTLQFMAQVYRQSGNELEAYNALQNAIRVKDSFITVNSEARMVEMQTIYETEKKQQQIDLQQEQLSKKNYILAATILLSVMLALLGFSSYRRNKLKQQTRLQAEIMRHQEMATMAVIEAEEGERQRIARDLHDGVGQMMSVAKMNLSAFESETTFNSAHQKISLEKVIELVDESCREIRNVSHNMMPKALLRNSLAAAVGDFIGKLDKKNLDVHFYSEGFDERLNINTETVLYRVIQECVNNVIKHSHATTLDISMTKEKESINITIEDNGQGFETTSIEKFDSIGLKNIRTRVEYLKGTVDFDSAPGRGTVVAIFVPV